jgi:DNA-directed RNA polymerase subunit N (RpoN/RPB10)
MKTERCLCGKSISEDEKHDSELVGTQPKCRECLEELGLSA